MTIEEFTEMHVIYNQTLLINAIRKTNTIIDFAEVDESDMDENGYYPEVMQWWLVDSWLTEQLKKQGEIIASHLFDNWWGRQCAGQAVYLDFVIKSIYENTINK